jgi:hypothetical protein
MLEVQELKGGKWDAHKDSLTVKPIFFLKKVK